MDHDQFMREILSLELLYSEVKEIITLAENVNKGQKTFVALVNEPRNAFDHIMRCIKMPDRIEYEFNEAKEHLYRAGYDAYEIIASEIGNRIDEDMYNYEPAIISIIFPLYYTELRPQLLEIKETLANARAHKQVDPSTKSKSFKDYAVQITQLVAISNTVSRMIPDLEKEKAKALAKEEERLASEAAKEAERLAKEEERLANEAAKEAVRLANEARIAEANKRKSKRVEIAEKLVIAITASVTAGIIVWLIKDYHTQIYDFISKLFKKDNPQIP